MNKEHPLPIPPDELNRKSVEIPIISKEWLIESMQLNCLLRSLKIMEKKESKSSYTAFELFLLGVILGFMVFKYLN